MLMTYGEFKFSKYLRCDTRGREQGGASRQKGGVRGARGGRVLGGGRRGAGLRAWKASFIETSRNGLLAPK